MKWILGCALALSALAASAQAGPVLLGDSDSWVAPGSDTLSSLGFVMQNVDLTSIADYTNVTSFGTPLGTVSMDTSANKRTVPTNWSTWSHGATPAVLFVDSANSVTWTLPSGVGAVDFYVEPNLFSVYDITVDLGGGVTSTQSVDGTSGAKYFGAYTTSGSIHSLTISADPNASGFAFGEIRVAAPEPALPLLVLLGFGFVGLRRRRRAKAVA